MHPTVLKTHIDSADERIVVVTMQLVVMLRRITPIQSLREILENPLVLLEVL